MKITLLYKVYMILRLSGKESTSLNDVNEIITEYCTCTTKEHFIMYIVNKYGLIGQVQAGVVSFIKENM